MNFLVCYAVQLDIYGFISHTFKGNQSDKERKIMAHNLKTWNADQLKQMNEETFLVEVLDMIKISPVTADTDSDIEKMKSKLAHVEAMIKDRLEG